MVSVRVPESKEKEYRKGINKFVDEKFENNGKLEVNTSQLFPKKNKKLLSTSNFKQDESKTTQKTVESKEFQELREFVNKLYKAQEEKKEH
ncbi:MAG: hypothetical protein ACFFAH_03565 [Promethearchaeota archaeon]